MEKAIAIVMLGFFGVMGMMAYQEGQVDVARVELEIVMVQAQLQANSYCVEEE